MLREEFEKNMYITYLDEVVNYTFGDMSYKSIVSISMAKSVYINDLEMKWSELRKSFNVPDGVCLHFTEIKALLNPSYFNRQENERCEEIEKIFCNNGVVDKEKLNRFYNKVLDIADSIDFDLIITGKRFKRNEMSKNKLIKEYMNSEWYILFKEHLDLLAEYILMKSYSKFNLNRSTNKKLKILKTKLRYDGDYGLMPRDDFRDAYAHIISNGTKKYNGKLAKQCFDNLKFVDKTEVGLCNTCEKGCNVRSISHAGNEILDFLALYISNTKCKDSMIRDYMEFGNKDNQEANNYYDKNIKIYINDQSIYPNKKINKKIFC